MRILIVSAVFSLFVVSAFAQGEVVDGITPKRITLEKGIIPYDEVREADVFWSKRLWRVIDVREKMNLKFAYPQQPLIEILHTAAMKGELTVYDNTVRNSDQFLEVLDPDKVGIIGASKDTMWQKDIYTQQDIQVFSENVLTWDKIIKYKIKEDWFFDEETSTFQVRIIGIAPVMEAYDSQGNYLGDETMYWIYYPDLRPFLSQYEAFNEGNDAIRLSWEDIFEARWFSSYIYKESNVYDRNINEYVVGVDALFESERIKNELFEFEHDLWTY